MEDTTCSSMMDREESAVLGTNIILKLFLFACK